MSTTIHSSSTLEEALGLEPHRQRGAVIVDAENQRIGSFSSVRDALSAVEGCKESGPFEGAHVVWGGQALDAQAIAEIQQTGWQHHRLFEHDIFTRTEDER
jgi:hypothetical protein